MSLAVPQFRELSVAKLRSQVKEVEELSIHFSNYIRKEVHEKSYLIAMISILKSSSTKELVAQARDKRSIFSTDDKTNLVEIISEMQDALKRISPQKSVVLET